MCIFKKVLVSSVVGVVVGRRRGPYASYTDGVFSTTLSQTGVELVDGAVVWCQFRGVMYEAHRQFMRHSRLAEPTCSQL
jgi:hypothetical protein